MIKALVADDEEMIRNGITKLLQKDSEITVVAQAEDGEMALEMATEHLPDLLLVDINMPFMNGLEFIERLGDVVKNAVVIVITGYDDFSYAQKSIKLGVFDYLLKPVMEEPFFDCIHRAKDLLARTRKQVQYLEWARLQVEKNRPTLLSIFFAGWLQNSYSEAEVSQNLAYLGIDLPTPLGVTVITYSLPEMDLVNEQKWDENLLYYAIENISSEVFAEVGSLCTCRDSRSDLVLLSACEDSEIWNKTAQTAVAMLREHLLVDASYAQAVSSNLAGMPDAYDAATDELRTRLKVSPLIQRVRRYIDDNYSDSDLSLQQVAGVMNVSPSHLSRLFRHECGFTFIEYLTKMRIRTAAKLLTHGNLKVYEVAEMVGYANQHYFSSAFKRVLGLSPLEYRKGIEE